MNVLGIETSCDETSAAVVHGGVRVLSNLVFSQIAQHRPYGGVVPEIACRSHVEELPGILQQAVDQAGVSWDQIDAIAVTHGPGLASSLLIGLSAAKALALRLGKPLIAVNHIEAHLYSLFLPPARRIGLDGGTEGAGAGAPRPEEVCPMIVLMVSGGHTCLIRMEAVGRYRLLGQTLDDAAGEALDKGANVLRLGYPGGPAIETAACGGNPGFVKFPRGMEKRMALESAGALDRALCFSFSGLKTALLYYVREHPGIFTDGRLKDVAASYQEAVFDALLLRVHRALQSGKAAAFGCVGGVAKNQRLREKLEKLCGEFGIRLILAPLPYCTDNAAMVAAVAGTGVLPSADLEALDVLPDLGVRST